MKSDSNMFHFQNKSEQQNPSVLFYNLSTKLSTDTKIGLCFSTKIEDRRSTDLVAGIIGGYESKGIGQYLVVQKTEKGENVFRPCNALDIYCTLSNKGQL